MCMCVEKMVSASMLVLLAHAAALQNPRIALNAAATRGDFDSARKIILQNPISSVDLDAALACAARRSQLHLMQFLVDCGAADFDLALVAAATFDQPKACVWILEHERFVPNEAIEAAQLAAASASATNAEWTILSRRTS